MSYSIVQRTTIFSIFLVCFGVIAACGGTTTQAPTPAAAKAQSTGTPAAKPSVQPSGKLTVALVAEPPDLDLLTQTTATREIPVDNVYQPLADIDSAGATRPVLATSWQQVAPLSWTFTLRQGVTFHDGTAFSAASAAATINYYIKLMADKKANSGVQTELDSLSAAEAQSVDTLSITTKTPQPNLPRKMFVVMMFPSSVIAAPDPSAAVRDTAVGTGPYRFVAWNRGKSLDLQAWSGYWDAPPSIKDVSFVFIPDPNTRISAVQSGEVDLAVADVDTVDQAPKAVTKPSDRIMYLRFGETKQGSPTANLDFRQALDYSIDRAGIAKALFHGKMVPASQVQLVGSPANFPGEFPPRPYDVAKAKESLLKSGLQGATISIGCRNDAAYIQSPSICQTVTQAWQSLGLTVNMQLMDPTEWLKHTAKADFDVFLQSSVNTTGDPVRIWNTFATCKGAITSYLSCDKADALVQSYSATADAGKQKAIAHELGQLLYDDPPVAVIGSSPQSYAATKRVVWDGRSDAYIVLQDISLGK